MSDKEYLYPDWGECLTHQCIHCWKYHIDDAVRSVWLKLSKSDRMIIGRAAKEIADNENWECR